MASTREAAKRAVSAVGGRVLQRACDCGQHTGGGECNDCKKKKKMPLQRHANGSAAPAIMRKCTLNDDGDAGLHRRDGFLNGLNRHIDAVDPDDLQLGLREMVDVFRTIRIIDFPCATPPPADFVSPSLGRQFPPCNPGRPKS